MQCKYSYDEIFKLFEKYGCKLLNLEDEFYDIMQNGTKKVNIIPKCGHNMNNVSLLEFLKYKRYLYCIECIKSDKFKNRNCLSCNKIFIAQNDNQHFCNRICSNTKTCSEQTKNKIKKNYWNSTRINLKNNKKLLNQKMYPLGIS